MMKTKIYIITSLILLALFTSCQKSVIPDRTFVADGAKVCFVNLSADIVTTNTCEMNLYFNGSRVTTQQSTVSNRLRGIPYRSSYPGVVVQSPAATTYPTSYIGAEYFNATPGATKVMGKDTLLFTGQDTLFSVDFTFEKDKYYTIYAMDLRTAMTPIIVKDSIVPFGTLKKVKVRAVNALYGVGGTGKVDIWFVHQPSSAELGKAPYKFASDLDPKVVTAFTDTISSGSYKWAVTLAGTVPTSITAPTPDPLTGSLLGKAYTLVIPGASTVIAQAATGTTFTQRTTYSLLLYGQVGKSSFLAPAGSLFRNRLL